MATNNGTILSLYRLEFYKKKRHWKLSKEYETSGTPNELNETYCISVEQSRAVRPGGGGRAAEPPRAGHEPEYTPSETLYSQSTVNDHERAALDISWESVDILPSYPDDNGRLLNQCASEGDSSFEEFVRGARQAPHSSELDLTRHSVGTLAWLCRPFSTDTHPGRGRGRLARHRDAVIDIQLGRPRRV